MPLSRPATTQERKAWVDDRVAALSLVLAIEGASRAVEIDKFIFSAVSFEDQAAVRMLHEHIVRRSKGSRSVEFDWLYVRTQFERQSNEFRATLADIPDEEIRRRRIRTEIPKDELDAVLAAHRTWLWSGGRAGTQANLAGRRFSLVGDDVDLARADLRWSDMTGSVLDRVSLVGASLRWACFDGVYMPLADLRNATLVGARGRGANLWQAKFAGANMWGADLQGALLDRAIFDPDAADTGPSFRLGPDGVLGRSPTSDGFTDVTRVDFRDARLRDARLGTVFGGTARSFAGANVANAQLPASIEKFDALAQASEALKTIHIVIATMLVTCAYVLLTYQPTVCRLIPARSCAADASSPEAKMQLINLGYRGAAIREPRIDVDDKAAEPKLPVVNVDVSPTAFAWISPLIVLALYMFLYSSLRRLWLAFANLPATFPDGTDLDERGYPSPISGLVRRHLPLLRANQSASHKFERWVTGGIIYFTAPLTIASLLVIDGLTAVPIRVLAVHVAALGAAAFICIAMSRLMASIVTDRTAFKVDRLNNEELRNFVEIQKDQNQPTLRRAIAGLQA